MDDKRTPKKISRLKPIGTRIRGRPRKRWIADIEDMQIRGIKGRESNVRKENGRESLRRLKPIWGCNASERRKSLEFSNEKFVNPWVELCLHFLILLHGVHSDFLSNKATILKCSHK